MSDSTENQKTRLDHSATDEQISQLFDFTRRSSEPASNAHEAALRAVFMAGYNAGVAAVVADLPKSMTNPEPEGTHIFTGRATGWDQEGYYYPNWDHATPVEVRADTRDEAFEKAHEQLGLHPRFGTAGHGNRKHWPGWKINWTSVRVVK